MSTFFAGEKIGEGAFGYAVKAIDKKTGTLRAVKVISKPSLGDDEVVGIKNEVKVLQKMKHECIIKAYGFFETGVNIYIAMEHCSGGELYERITESNYSEKNAARIIRQVCLLPPSSLLPFLSCPSFPHVQMSAYA